MKIAFRNYEVSSHYICMNKKAGSLPIQQAPGFFILSKRTILQLIRRRLHRGVNRFVGDMDPLLSFLADSGSHNDLLGRLHRDGDHKVDAFLLLGSGLGSVSISMCRCGFPSLWPPRPVLDNPRARTDRQASSGAKSESG